MAKSFARIAKYVYLCGDKISFSTMRRLPIHERQLLDVAHQVLAESRQVMLPRHQDLLEARLETFDEIQVHDVNVTGIQGGRYKTNLLLLTHPRQRPVLAPGMSIQDTVIIDLSLQQPDPDAMRSFLLSSEEHRYWHHAPWAVINKLRQGTPRM